MIIETTDRSIRDIADEIALDWKKVNYAAVPYLQAMAELDSINDDYYYDSAREVVLRFLCNAGTWRGETAKRVKLELKRMAGIK
jgi:hypothetical protein